MRTIARGAVALVAPLLGLHGSLLLQDVVPASAAAPLVITPRALDFGTVWRGQTMDLPVSARNGAPEGALTIEHVRLLPSSSPAFRILIDGCSDTSLRPGVSCTVRVAFRPTVAQPFTASLSFETEDGTSTVAVSGSGVEASPTTIGGSTIPSPTTLPAPPAPTLPSPSVPATTTFPVNTTMLASTPTTVRSDEDRLDECERLARSARVSYEPARTMLAGQTAQVRVTASVGDDGSATTVRTTPVSTTIVFTTLRCEVQAQLRGVDFRIEPSGFQLGSFLDRPVVAWSWDVVPLKPGRKQLTLEIRSVAAVAGRRIEGAGGELYTSAITVDAERESLGEKTRRWSGDIVDHPLVRGFGSLLVVLGSLAGWWRGLLKRPWPWTKPAEIPTVAAPPDRATASLT